MLKAENGYGISKPVHGGVVGMAAECSRWPEGNGLRSKAGKGRSKSSIGFAHSPPTTTLPPIFKARGPASAGSQIRRKAFHVSEEVKGIVKIFKEVAKPDAPGITKREFRRIFFKRDPANRHRVDTKLEDEICSDMFRILDKKGEGYVTLEDLLKHFIPRKQLDRLPVEFMNTVTKTKKNIEKQIETPRLPEELESEIREIYELWTGYAQEYDGELNREIFEKILAGTSAGRKPEFCWTDAREAADRLFAELPVKALESVISFGDMANHLQDVMAVNYSELSDGSVQRFQKHSRIQVKVKKEIVTVKRNSKDFAGLGKIVNDPPTFAAVTAQPASQQNTSSIRKRAQEAKAAAAEKAQESSCQSIQATKNAFQEEK